jgi:oligosaccharide repeat unit polymerase
MSDVSSQERSESARFRQGTLVWALSCVLILLAVLAWLNDGSTSSIFSLLYGGIALVPLAADRKAGTSVDPFNPYFGLALLLYLYSVSTILFVEEFGVTYYGEAAPASALNQYALACLLGLVGLVLGTRVYSRIRPLAPAPLNSGNGNSHDLQTRILFGGLLWLAILLSPFYADRFNFLDVVSYADAALAVRLERMADSAAGIREVFLKDFPSTVVICWATAVLFNRQAPTWRRVLGGAVLMAFLATSLLSGWRGQLMSAALVPVMYFHYRVRHLRLREVLAAGVGAYVLVNALTIMRAASSIGEMLALLGDERLERGLWFLALSQSGELATSANLLRLIIGIDTGETGFMWGGLVASQIGSVVPRALWPDRPPLGNELFAQVFYSDVYEAGGGFGFFVLQDGYWDFGLAGVVVYSGLLAVLVRWLYDELVVRRANTFSFLLYAVMYGQLVMSSVRTGLLASLKAAMMLALPFLVAVLLARLVEARRRAARASP